MKTDCSLATHLAARPGGALFNCETGIKERGTQI
jgi:hypothetical protein